MDARPGPRLQGEAGCGVRGEGEGLREHHQGATRRPARERGERFVRFVLGVGGVRGAFRWLDHVGSSADLFYLFSQVKGRTGAQLEDLYRLSFPLHVHQRDAGRYGDHVGLRWVPRGEAEET